MYAEIPFATFAPVTFVAFWDISLLTLYPAHDGRFGFGLIYTDMRQSSIKRAWLARNSKSMSSIILRMPLSPSGAQ